MTLLFWVLLALSIATFAYSLLLSLRAAALLVAEKGEEVRVRNLIESENLETSARSWRWLTLILVFLSLATTLLQ